MLNAREVSEEILYTCDAITHIDHRDIAVLKQRAAATLRRRFRLCAHDSKENLLHEMLIVLGRGSYVRPHRHEGKTESFHLIEGALTVVLFDESGAITRIVPMGDFRTDRAFFYRLADSRFHTVLPESDFAIFHETTNGPFRREDTIFAPWSPHEDDESARARYISELEGKMRTFTRHTQNGP